MSMRWSEAVSSPFATLARVMRGELVVSDGRSCAAAYWRFMVVVGSRTGGHHDELSLPIIYVRGYAGPTSGVDAQVDDPFYGFNKGATREPLTCGLAATVTRCSISLRAPCFG